MFCEQKKFDDSASGVCFCSISFLRNAFAFSPSSTLTPSYFFFLLPFFYLLVHLSPPLGILDKMDYIKGMGFDAIWISPVVDNFPCGYHGYWARNKFQIEAQFGGADELLKLVKGQPCSLTALPPCFDKTSLSMHWCHRGTVHRCPHTLTSRPSRQVSAYID